MTKLRLWAKNFLARDREEGATMAEYALLLALIAVVLIATIQLFTGAIVTAFTAATTVLNASGS